MVGKLSLVQAARSVLGRAEAAAPVPRSTGSDASHHPLRPKPSAPSLLGSRRLRRVLRTITRRDGTGDAEPVEHVQTAGSPDAAGPSQASDNPFVLPGTPPPRLLGDELVALSRGNDVERRIAADVELLADPRFALTSDQAFALVQSLMSVIEHVRSPDGPQEGHFFEAALMRYRQVSAPLHGEDSAYDENDLERDACSAWQRVSMSAVADAVQGILAFRFADSFAAEETVESERAGSDASSTEAPRTSWEAAARSKERWLGVVQHAAGSEERAGLLQQMARGFEPQQVPITEDLSAAERVNVVRAVMDRSIVDLDAAIHGLTGAMELTDGERDTFIEACVNHHIDVIEGLGPGHDTRPGMAEDAPHPMFVLLYEGTAPAAATIVRAIACLRSRHPDPLNPMVLGTMAFAAEDVVPKVTDPVQRASCATALAGALRAASEAPHGASGAPGASSRQRRRAVKPLASHLAALATGLRLQLPADHPGLADLP